MSSSCPDPEALAAWLDRELGERRADEVRDHVARCSVCTAQVDALRRLIGDLAAPATAEVSAAQVSRVMRTLDAPRARAARWPWLAGGACAAFAALAIALWPAPSGDAGSFQPRGGGSAAPLDHEVGTTLYAVAGRATALGDGAHVRPETAFVLGYRNARRAGPLWALAFAVDAAGAVHWLYPAYLTAGEDPPAVPLAAAAHETLMTESVILDHPAPGPLRVVVIVAPSRARVSAIEARHGGELALPALRARFADAAISQLTLEVVP